ncbi:hypothetical protein [Maridesulfovibrio sp.]|uniref:hypothetical protein n=1 Tax=Maridesulfovibrio sp. TaxID=2795000 RepID=UPI002A1878DE|nr:hypothetical protein [Maridesulfovibrio sp.]
MFNPAHLLNLGGTICFLVAILHVAIIIAGPAAYRYFGAGEDLSSMAERNSSIPALVTAFIATVIATFGLYAFSGAGEIHRLPFLGPVLLLIGTIFGLRGLALPLQLYFVMTGSRRVQPREIAFSLVSLLTGFCFLYGTKLNWDFIFN